jgi:uncharacterized protein YjbJ (UPF0337 family)
LSNSSTKDKQAKGSVKESVGHAVGNNKMLDDFFPFCFKLTNDPREAEGKIEHAEGKVQHAVGEIKAAVGK